jgi:hypothetical protein
VPCQNRPRSVKLVDYDDDDDEPTAPAREGNPADVPLTTSPCGDDSPAEEERELKLPVREKKEDEVDTQAFLGGSTLLAQKKAHQKNSLKVRSPQFKNVFQKISWKLSTPGGGDENENNSSAGTATGKSGEASGGSVDKLDGSNSISVGNEHGSEGSSGEPADLIAAKRKLAMDEAGTSESLLKKTKTCTPISST